VATTLERTITVPGTVDDVFAYVADFANSAEWDPGIVSATRTDHGPLGVGATFDLVARFMGRDLATTYRIAEYEPPERLVVVGGTSNFTSTDEIVVRPIDEGVAVDYTAVFELDGLIRVAEPFLRRTFGTLADKAVAGLQRVLAA
jgi:carbon monoxide dehydrogenase subunit G